MPAITDQAVVIRQWDFSETSQTVSLFTREHGVIRGLAKGARREKGSFSGGLDGLTGGQIVAIVKPGRDLATLTAWHVQQMYPAVRTHLAANRAGLYMADLIHHMIIDHDPHPLVFDEFIRSLEALDDASKVELSLLGFQWILLRECGYEPQVERDALTGCELPKSAKALVFSASAGGLLAEQLSSAQGLSDGKFVGIHEDDKSCVDRVRSTHDRVNSHNIHAEHARSLRRPAGGFWRVRAETVGLLQALAAGKSLDDASPATVGRANRLLAAYIREVLGQEPATMRWAFSDLTSKLLP